MTVVHSCCVDASVIEPLNLPRLGHVMLRGLSTDLVHADLGVFACKAGECKLIFTGDMCCV